MHHQFAPQYKPAIATALLMQALLLLAAAAALDSGALFHISLNAVAVFWVAAVFEIRRHRAVPRPWGLYCVKYGYLAVLPLNYIFSVYIRQAMGQALP